MRESSLRFHGNNPLFRCNFTPNDRAERALGTQTMIPLDTSRNVLILKNVADWLYFCALYYPRSVILSGRDALLT
jgi:hypothetical protein